MTHRSAFVIQATVTIEEIDPPIWRRLLLPTTLNLAELHHVLQAAFGWYDAHLHEFIIGGLAYGAPELAREGFDDEPRLFEASEVHLRDFDLYHVPQPSFLYHYDFGDSWMHRVTFEALVPKDPTGRYPACTGGARHRPPEDAGGPRGYADFLEAWSDPAHEEHEAMRRWAGRAFHPEKFSPEATDKAVRAAWRKARGDYLFRRL
jgi:Plasmid pRiA4b ORF-3-like protein